MTTRRASFIGATLVASATETGRAMKQYLRNVVDDAERSQVVPTSPGQLALFAKLMNYVELSRKLIAQDRNTSYD